MTLFRTQVSNFDRTSGDIWLTASLNNAGLVEANESTCFIITLWLLDKLSDPEISNNDVRVDNITVKTTGSKEVNALRLVFSGQPF
jgi:hypothetical protein